MQQADEQLVADYLNGEKESLEILIQRYLKPIYSFIYRYLGNAPDAEDVTQEVFVKVWRHLRGFKRGKSFKTWILAIAKNSAIDFLKKKKAVPFSALETEEGENFFSESLADPAPLPPELLDRTGLAQTLAAAIERLASPYRMVLFLRYNDHFTFREIAETLKEPLDTVKSRHRRALIALRALLTEN